MKTTNYLANGFKLTKSRTLIGVMCLFGSGISNAQSVTTLSGQYSCIFNRSFGGFDANYLGDSTYSNLMLYIDFNTKLFEVNAIAVYKYGDAAAGNYRVTASGSLTWTDGPIKNSFAVAAPLTTLKYTGEPSFSITGVSINFYLSPVNNGNTLLVQGPDNTGRIEPSGSAPNTGICNKI